MRTTSLTKAVEVGSQPALSDIAEAAARFRAVLNLRPDGEEPGQPASADVAAAAARHGLAYHHIPVVPGQIEDEQVRRFGAALDQAGGPVFAFCRTGTRACQLWALNAVGGGEPVDAVLRRAAEAGYDLSALRPRLEAAARRG